MVDAESAKSAGELMWQYEYNWGRKIDLSCVPRGMTQEDFVVVMERIVETGESVLMGWNKCFCDKEITGKK